MDNKAQHAVDPEAERKLVRKIDLNLIPLVMLLFTLAYLNRANIGNARLYGLDADLKVDDTRFHWLVTVFYISYILFQPLALMWRVCPPHRWATFCVVAFGIAASAQYFVRSWSEMMVARFFLGVFEAALVPGVTFFLSFFYLRNELGLRCGFYLSSVPLATCFAGALASGIAHITKDTNHSWRLLFLIEALPAILAAPLTWFSLPDSPEKAKFLSPSEQAMAAARTSPQTGVTNEKAPHGLQWREIPRALGDYKLWITGVMLFSCNLSFTSIPIFLPTILSKWGYKDVEAQGYTVLPYFCSFLVVIITTYIADRTSQYGITICFLSLVGVAGYLVLVLMTSQHPDIQYAGVFFVASGIFPAVANIMPWMLNNQENTTRKGVGVALVNFVGQCGPLLGLNLPWEKHPEKGMWVCGSFLLFNAVLAIVLRMALWHENRKSVRGKKDVFEYHL